MIVVPMVAEVEINFPTIDPLGWEWLMYLMVWEGEEVQKFESQIRFPRGAVEWRISTAFGMSFDNRHERRQLACSARNRLF